MSLSVQLQTMLTMIAIGGWIGASIDTYGRLVRHRTWYKWVTMINDGLFWIFQSLLVFFVLLQVNEGEMRFYILLAILCGYATYKALLQSVFQRVLERTIWVIVKTYLFLKSLVVIMIINPTKELLKLLYTVCMMILTASITVIVFIGKIIWVPFSYIGKYVRTMVPVKKISGRFNIIKCRLKHLFKRKK